MSALFEGVPAMPPNILEIRGKLHNQPGLHTIFDVPVRAYEQHAPHDSFDGVTMSVLIYTVGDRYARFRIAFGHVFQVGHQTAFFEIGTFADDNKIKCGHDNTGPTKTDTSRTAAVKTFYWIQFVRDASSFSILFNGDSYHKEALPGSPPVYDGMAAWVDLAENQDILCFECHFTCDKSNVSTLLPMNHWLISDEVNQSRSFQQSANFKLGGSMTIFGKYKKTGQGDDKIKLGIMKDSEVTIDPPSDRSADTMLHLTIEKGELVLIYQDNHKTLLTGVDGTHTVPVKIIENFDVISVCMTSGMVNPEV
ncbi:uncharacterized protein LOC135375996 isoform X1 [Ornithodoros turicata]|uniref:uncharacterized protein LOC135375996 isoform X1 n=1 Tax=Ornithodoros turicata TaxID=34597 RepID=UPI00313A071F